VPELVVELRGVDQRLRGDAADVQADAAGLLLLDDQRLLLELAQPDAGDIAARAGADHHGIDAEGFSSHGAGS
jgi:hypothetical protein